MSAKILLTHWSGDYSLLELDAKVEISPVGEISTKFQVVSNEKIKVGKNLRDGKIVHENPCISKGLSEGGARSESLVVFSTTTFYKPGEVVLYSPQKKEIIGTIKINGVIDAFVKGKFVYIVTARTTSPSESGEESCGPSCVEILDISNPAEPKSVGTVKKYVRDRESVLLDGIRSIQEMFLLCDPYPVRVMNGDLESSTEFKVILKVEKRHILKMVKWNEQIVFAHRFSPGEIRYISFASLGVESKSFPPIFFDDPIRDIIPTQWGLVVIRNDFSDYFNPAGGIDIVVNGEEAIRLDFRAPGNAWCLKENILAVTINRRTRDGIDVPSKEAAGKDDCKISYGIRVYDIKSRKKIKAFDIESFTQYLEIVNGCVMFEDLNHIHFVGIHTDSHYKIEMRNVSMNAQLIE